MAETRPDPTNVQAQGQAQGQTQAQPGAPSDVDPKTSGSRRAAEAAQKEEERRRRAEAGGGEEKPPGEGLRPEGFETEVEMRQGPTAPLPKETPPSDAELFARDEEEARAAAEEEKRPRVAALAMKPRRGRPAAGSGEDGGEGAMMPRQVQIDPVALGMAIAAANETIRTRQESLVATEGLDETAPGGVYVVEGKVVNAFNEEIKPEYLDKLKEQNLAPAHEAIHEHAQRTAQALRRRSAEGRR
jgi:hypothetical protein